MARIALIKPFTGLNLGVSQLSGELQRAGHDSRIIYLKDFRGAPKDAGEGYLEADYKGIMVAAKGRDLVWNFYKPISEREYELLLGVLRGFDAQMVGFSLTSTSLRVACDVTRRIQRELGVPVIWGGTGPTLEPELSLEYADLVCINEGEAAIVDLAGRLDRKESLIGVPGVWGKENGAIVKTPNPPLLDLEQIAMPDFERSRTYRIENNNLRENVYPNNLGRQYAIMTARGCPFSCSFCIESVYQDMFGKKGSLRRRSVDLVMQELTFAKAKYDPQSIMFYDDVFTTHRQWLVEFGPRYRQEVDLPFWCYTYPTTTRTDDIAILRDAGCVSMTMGIQSGSQRILNEAFERPTPLIRARDAVKTVLDAGIRCFVDLITRSEFETEEDLRETFEFLNSLPRGVECVGFGHMTKFPTYGYTARVAETKQVQTVSDEVYAYYHRLYWLALTDLPEAERRAIASDPKYRKEPELLEAFLPETTAYAFILPESDSASLKKARPAIVDIGIATFSPDDSPQEVADAGKRKLPLVG